MYLCANADKNGDFVMMEGSLTSVCANALALSLFKFKRVSSAAFFFASN